MGGPIALASALSRLVTIKCPWCGHQKAVMKKPATFRVCAKCKKHFPDPIAKKK